MNLKQKYNNYYCLIAKSINNQHPHVISCSIGIESENKAIIYSNQLSKTKSVYNKRKNIYQWTQQKKLTEVLFDNNILITPNDILYISELLEQRNELL